MSWHWGLDKLMDICQATQVRQFLQRNVLSFDFYSIEVCLEGQIYKRQPWFWDGLVLNNRHAITWTTDGTVQWCIYTSPGPRLNIKTVFPGIGISHYSDVIMGSIACQITSLTIVYSNVYSGAYQRKHQSSASLAFSAQRHKGPVTRKLFPFDDVVKCYKDETAVRPSYSYNGNHCTGESAFFIKMAPAHRKISTTFVYNGTLCGCPIVRYPLLYMHISLFQHNSKIKHMSMKW